MDTVGDDDKASFLALEELFDDNLATCGSENHPRQHLSGCPNSSLPIVGDDHTLTCRKSTRLDSQRRVLRVDISNGLVQIGKACIRGGRDPMPFHEALGEAFRPFQDRGFFMRAKTLAPGFFEDIDYA